MEEISYLIKSKRLRNGWSQINLANKIGVKQNAISRIENNNYFDLKILLKILDILKIKIKFYDLEMEEYI